MHINAKNGGVTQQQQQNNHYFSQNQTKKWNPKEKWEGNRKRFIRVFHVTFNARRIIKLQQYIHTNCKCSLIHFKINAFDVAIYVVYDIVYRYILRLMNNICMYIIIINFIRNKNSDNNNTKTKPNQTTTYDIAISYFDIDFQKAIYMCGVNKKFPRR